MFELRRRVKKGLEEGNRRVKRTGRKRGDYKRERLKDMKERGMKV